MRDTVGKGRLAYGKAMITRILNALYPPRPSIQSLLSIWSACASIVTCRHLAIIASRSQQSVEDNRDREDDEVSEHQTSSIFSLIEL